MIASRKAVGVDPATGTGVGSFAAGPLRRAALRVAATVVLALGFAPLAAAQGFPSKPIRIIVPYAAGGSIDIVTRQYAEQLAQKFGVPVVVENRPGAAGNIGSEEVAKAAPDGYTLLIATNTMTQNPTFGPRPPFDLLTAFEPVSMLVRAPLVIAANEKLAMQTGRDLIAAARAQPGKYTISSGQLDAYVALINSRAKIELTHVPYKGGGPAITDAMAGHVDMVLAVYPALSPHLTSGRLKALAITSGKRIDVLAGVPTLTELGVDLNVTFWYGVLAPAGTPQAVVARLAQATQEVLASGTDFAAKLRSTGMEPEPVATAEFRERLRSELGEWRELGKAMPQLVPADMK
jgi:tripartite-type tricarboxylate transporter receptor subunit TctC